MEVKGQATANHVQSIALYWEQRHIIISDHSALISLLCTSTLPIYHVTNSGTKNGCSLKCQQLQGYHCRCVRNKHRYSPLSHPFFFPFYPVSVQMCYLNVISK